MTEGRKDDTGKLRWSLFPSGTLKSILEVLEIGAKKYDVDNWKKVPNARTRYYDALMRHVDAWWGGETNDPEDGKHHLAHAGCCLLFLLSLDEASAAVPSADVWGPRVAVSSGVRPGSSKKILLETWDGQKMIVGAAKVDWNDPALCSYRVAKE